MRSASRGSGTRLLALVCFTLAGWSCRPTAYEQSYLRASHNFAFRRAYPDVDALFNAFDFGHAALYETEVRDPSALARTVDTLLYREVTTRVLRHPSRVVLDEHALAPRYTTLAPELAAAFEWAHMLHRQIYDVLADPRIPDEERDARVSQVLRYYRSRSDLALSDTPKSMALMEEQPFSLALRRAAPSYNSLIWSYHWLQMALYEALLAEPPGAARDALVARAVATFWSLVESRGRLPSVMPMSPAIAPRFTARYPDAAAVFDNLHALHDVAGDILASRSVAPTARRSALLRAAAEYRDSVTASSSRAEWISMAREMGVEAMGGTLVPDR